VVQPAAPGPVPEKFTTTVKLDGNYSAFMQSNGTQKFIEELAKSLGI
jgi:hypothetical protein